MRAVKKIKWYIYNYKDFKYHYLNIFEPKGSIPMSRSVLNELVIFYIGAVMTIWFNDLGRMKIRKFQLIYSF